MEKKNMVLLTVIAVATLLVAVVGATFAYFTATIQDNRTDDGGTKGKAEIVTKQVPNSLIVEKSKSGFESFNDSNVYPGHKELVQLKVTSPADNEADTYFNIVYEGTNTFPQDAIKFQIYESTEDLKADFDGISKKAFECEQISEKEDTSENFKIYEKCTLNTELGVQNAHPVLTVGGVSTTNYGEDVGNGSQSNKTVLNGNLPFVITGNSVSKTMYYYVVVEYVNKESDQTETDKGKSLKGKINVEVAAKSGSGSISDTDEDKLTKPDE